MRLLRIFLFVSFAIVCGVNNAQIPTYQWAYNVGGNSSEYLGNMQIGQSGAIYVTGFYSDTVDFDPSPGSAINISKGIIDIYVAKYDATGNYIWHISIGGTGDDRTGSIYVDQNENVYVTGYFEDTVDFDPSGNVANLTSNGLDDIFLAKFDSQGNYIWAFNIGGSIWDQGLEVYGDNLNNIYMAGTYRADVDFDPSANVATLYLTGTTDMFIAKYDSDGNYIWAKSIQGASGNETRPYSLKFDQYNNIYITGTLSGTVDMDPSANTVNLSSNGGVDIFVAKYNGNCEYQWAFNVGASGTDYARSIYLDQNDNIYITGIFNDTVDFDPSSGVSYLYDNLNSDVFIAKYNSAGNYSWAINLVGSCNAGGMSVTADIDGNVYVTGDFSLSTDFDPSSSTYNMTANSFVDMFVAKYDVAGNFMWAFQVGGPGIAVGKTIHIDNQGGIFIAGYLNDTLDADFDPSSNVEILSVNGEMDIFMVKYFDSLMPIAVPEVMFEQEKLTVYPNPSNGSFTVEMDMNENKSLSLKLYNYTGKLIHSEEISKIKGNYNKQLDISSYPKGVYILQIATDDNILTKKVVHY